MTKQDIVTKVSAKTGIEKVVVQACVEGMMSAVIEMMEKGDNVYLRGFGTFVVKKRAQKIGRNITAKTSVTIPAHCIPAFKPAKTFANKVKKNVKP